MRRLRQLDPIAAAYAAFAVLCFVLAAPLLATGDEGWRWVAGAGAVLGLLAGLIQGALVRLRARS